MNPCLPLHHTAATLHAWAVWRAAHSGWVAKVVAPACIRAAALALPLALPGAAFVPAPHGGVVFGGPVLSGPAYEIGAVFVPGVYDVPLWALVPFTAAHAAELASAEVGVGKTTSAATGGYPVTPMLSGDVPHWWPDREAGQGVRPIEVPEPSAWMVLMAALVGLLVVRRWVR